MMLRLSSHISYIIIFRMQTSIAGNLRTEPHKRSRLLTSSISAEQT